MLPVPTFLSEPSDGDLNLDDVRRDVVLEIGNPPVDPRPTLDDSTLLSLSLSRARERTYSFC